MSTSRFYGEDERAAAPAKAPGPGVKNPKARHGFPVHRIRIFKKKKNGICTVEGENPVTFCVWLPHLLGATENLSLANTMKVAADCQHQPRKIQTLK